MKQFWEVRVGQKFFFNGNSTQRGHLAQHSCTGTRESFTLTSMIYAGLYSRNSPIAESLQEMPYLY